VTIQKLGFEINDKEKICIKNCLHIFRILKNVYQELSPYFQDTEKYASEIVSIFSGY
jgi:hypothetical protein